MHSREDDDVVKNDISTNMGLEKNNQLFDFESEGALLTNVTQKGLSEIIVGDNF